MSVVTPLLTPHSALVRPSTSDSMPVTVEQTRSFLKRREARRQLRLDEVFTMAWHDFRAIIGMITARYAPTRIHQWGSLLDRIKGFYRIICDATTTPKSVCRSRQL